MYRRSFTHTFNNRGVSETVGALLILAMTVMMTGLLASQGGVMIQHLQDQSNQQQLENQFTKLAGQQATVGYGGGGRQYFQLQKGNEDFQTVTTQVTVKEFNNDTNTTGAVIYNETITGLSYNTSDSQYLIVSGGVFRHDKGTNYTEVLTHPSFDFTESTVTLPLISVNSSQDDISTRDELIMRHQGYTQSDSRYIESNMISIEITGPGYLGWGKSIKGQSGTEVNYNNTTNTSQAIFGVSEIVIDETNRTVTSTSSVTVTGSATITGNVSSPNVDGEESINGSISEPTRDYPTLDSYIRGVVQDARENATETTISNGDTVTAGYYYIDGDMSLTGGETTFDAQDGNVTVVVDGDMSITNDANVDIINTKDDRTVSFIVNGEEYLVSGGSPSVTVENETTGHHVVYGSSELDGEISQSATWEGIFYAPRETMGGSGSPRRGGGSKCSQSEVSMCIGGSANVSGAVIAGNMRLGQSATLGYDSNLREFSLPQKPVKDTERVEITFLHITKFRVTLTER